MGMTVCHVSFSKALKKYVSGFYEHRFIQHVDISSQRFSLGDQWLD
jgi:hypothetical protein